MLSQALWELVGAITEPDDEAVTWGALRRKVDRVARRVESHEWEQRIVGEDE